MWSLNGFILACLGMLLSITQPALGDHDSFPFEFRCGVGRIICGQEDTKTIQSICNEDFSIYFYGITDESTFLPEDYPMNFSVFAVDENKQETGRVSSTIDSLTEDITSAFSTQSLAIPDGACDNREVFIYFELSSLDRSKVFNKRIGRRIWPDFSAYNLKIDAVSTTGGADMSVIYLTDAIQTLNEGMQNFDLTVTYSATGGELADVIPISGEGNHVPTGLFAAAYITKSNRSVVSRAKCEENGYQEIPDIIGGDMPIATQQFQFTSELQALNLYDLVRGNDDTLDLCGEHFLILMLDPMRTLWNEVNVCDNFLVFNISSTRMCDTVQPRCEVIRNAWSGDLRAIYKGADPVTMRPIVNTFEFEGRAVIKVQDYKEMLYERKAHGRLAIIEHFVDQYLAEHSATICPSDMDLLQTLKDIEGVTDESETANVILPTQVMMAKDQMDMLRTGADVNSVKTEMETILNTLDTDFPGTDTVTMIGKEMTMRAAESVLNIVDHIEGGGSVDDIDGHYCDWLPEHLEHSSQTLMAGPDIEFVKELAGDVADAFVSKKEFSCLENMLKRFIKFATEFDTGNPDPRFLFDADDIANEDDLDRCGRPNKCIKKMHRVCEISHMDNLEPIIGSHDEICKLYIMKAMARSQYKFLFSDDIYHGYKENEMIEGKQCTRDPLKPEDGPPVLWRLKPDEISGKMYLSKGVAISDEYISWRKVAVCTCKPCEKEIGSMPDTTDWADTGTGSTTGEPLKKRRRRK